MAADAVARSPYAQGHFGEALPSTSVGGNPKGFVSGAGIRFEPVPEAPHVPAGGQGYASPVLSKQFQAEDPNAGGTQLGFRRTSSLGEGARLTVTQTGIAFGTKIGSNLQRSQSARGTRTNVRLPGGYYFRRSVSDQ